jgi:hypothetical protein
MENLKPKKVEYTLKELIEKALSKTTKGTAVNLYLEAAKVQVEKTND